METNKETLKSVIRTCLRVTDEGEDWMNVMVKNEVFRISIRDYTFGDKEKEAMAYRKFGAQPPPTSKTCSCGQEMWDANGNCVQCELEPQDQIEGNKPELVQIHQCICKTKPPNCDPGCRGWFVNMETAEVQRCDTCKRFEDDIAAAYHVNNCVMPLEPDKTESLEQDLLETWANELNNQREWAFGGSAVDQAFVHEGKLHIIFDDAEVTIKVERE